MKHEEVIARARAARERAAAVRKGVSDEIKARLDALDRRLAELGEEARAWLARQEKETAADLHAAQTSMSRTERRLEGELQLLEIKSEIRKAERLTADRHFTDAQMRLENAAGRIAHVEALIGDDIEGRRRLLEVQTRLYEAIQGVRIHADTSGEQLERVIQASDMLLESLEARAREAA
ncbi:MAG TPA: hypothetical protein VFF73_41190 [Planctomycetota bacterium]|nr:hypothetical protein [Planctomycetota bacterium]